MRKIKFGDMKVMGLLCGIWTKEEDFLPLPGQMELLRGQGRHAKCRPKAAGCCCLLCLEALDWAASPHREVELSGIIPEH
jgi:hypothetical protein